MVKQGKAGQIEVRAEIRYGHVWATIIVNGRQIESTTARPMPAQSGFPGPYQCGRVGALSEAEYLALVAEFAAAETEAAQTPERLRQQRDALAHTIRCAVAAIRDRRDDAFECGTGQIPSYDDPTIKAAEVALAVFDAAHPEIVAAIAVERKEAAERAANW